MNDYDRSGNIFSVGPHRAGAPRHGRGALAPDEPETNVSAPKRMPTVIVEARAEGLTREFFSSHLKPNTSVSYARAVWRLCQWCEERGQSLRDLDPVSLDSYFDRLRRSLSDPSIRVHVSAVRHWLDFLTERGALPTNPARTSRPSRGEADEASFTALDSERTRRLFRSLDVAVESGAQPLVAMRDRALCSVVILGRLRVGVAVAMEVRDFRTEDSEAWLRLRERGRPERWITCGAHTRSSLQALIRAAGFLSESRAPLFQSVVASFKRTGAFSGRALTASAAWHILNGATKTSALG